MRLHLTIVLPLAFIGCHAGASQSTLDDTPTLADSVEQTTSLSEESNARSFLERKMRKKKKKSRGDKTTNGRDENKAKSSKSESKSDKGGKGTKRSKSKKKGPTKAPKNKRTTRPTLLPTSITDPPTAVAAQMCPDTSSSEEWDQMKLNGDTLTFTYAIVPAPPSPYKQQSILCARLESTSESWVGFGISPAGTMLGGEGIIGLPEDGTVKKYILSNGQQGAARVELMEEDKQTLMNTNITQSDGKTMMEFAKYLKEDGEHEIVGDGENVFLYAMGVSNELGYHGSNRNNFKVTFESEESDRRVYADGADHTLDIPSDKKSGYTNILLERGSHLTIVSGVSIEAGGIDFSRGNVAISVRESSLKIQGRDIAVIGSSHVDNTIGDYGGDAITFFEGSKGHIGCDSFNPAPGGPTSRACEVGPGVDSTVSFCGRGEFCQLAPGVCNTKSGIHRGTCAKMPDDCFKMRSPVCGCDGRTHGNDCKAHASGVSVSRQGECANEKGQEACPECQSPDGKCYSMARCFVDPCSLPTACGETEECTSNYCGGCNAVCSPTKRLPVNDIADPTDRRTISCDNSGIRIVGGEGNQASEGGGGRGGVALRVYGKDTIVQINGATLKGGDGSINGKSLEIAEAEVTIHSGYMDGEILVAKRGKLNIHGGTFSEQIEVLGDKSSVTFHGCLDDITQRQGETYVEWTFGFSGDNDIEKQRVSVLVHDGGEMLSVGTGSCAELEPTGLPTPSPV
mmetsp:Transcript_35088/g.64355  ORF Transcript_35088/g.64355 Transcript_35088/m.64355 type:complete len:739 (+) Transcript_35088:131-2347(+)